MKHKSFAVAVILAVMVSVGRVSPTRAAPEVACSSTGTGGNWSAASTWTGCNAGVPGSNDTATITAGTTVTLDTNVTVRGTTVNGTLRLGTNILTNGGNSGATFSVASGGSLEIGDPNGITATGNSGNIQGPAARTYNTGANYTYNGTAAQVTGNGLPVTVNNLTINNAAGVTLSANMAITNLTVTSGSRLDLGAFTATVSGVLTNPGTIRKALAVGSTGTYNTFSLAGSYNGGALAINVTTQGTLSNLRVDRTDTNHPNATSGPGGSGTATGRYWNITPTGAGYTVDLTLPHNVTAPSVCEYVGGPGYGWNCASTSSTSNTVTRSGLTALSPWAVGNNVGPNAITLESISVHVRSDWAGVLLIGLALLAGGILVFSWARRKVYTK